ncbi:peptidoglycan-binding protein [Streptomyces decoyicus]|uniref:LysM peptidoglycan-binding domain-containing protein n=1 Tax=Streptomyces decoyicus TaxID=249567 RepID=UPI003864A39B
MTEYHVAVDSLSAETGQTTTTYLGTVDQAHVDEVRAIAALDDSPRFVKEHRQAGAFCVLRDDGALDVYVPTDAEPYEVRQPDPGQAAEGFAKGGAVPKGLTATVGESGAESYVPLARGASGPAYISGAARLGDQSIGGAMDHPESGARFTWHTTESPAGGSYLTSIGAYLIRVGAEPQVIYDPATDKLGQFGPLNQSGRALKNDGARRTNREGKVNIQVEVLGRAATPWTNGFDPAKKPNFQKLLAAGRAWGIPDVWPAGKPPAYPSGSSSRSRSVWQEKGGHYGHSQVPGNDHGDPGAIDTAKVPGKAAGGDTGSSDSGSSSATTYTVKKGDTLSSIAKAHKTTVAKLVTLNGLKDADKLSVGQKLKVPGAASKPSSPTYEPFPGSNFFHGGRNSPIITAMGRRLVAEGCGKYRNGPGPDWTNVDRASFAAWQSKYSKAHGLNWSAEDCNGIPGKTSWDALHVPNV